MPRITLPHNGWTERPYQEALWDHLCAGGKRAIAVWHRRAGKDDIALHYAAIAMHKRVGNVLALPPRVRDKAAKPSGLQSTRAPASAASMKRFPPELRESDARQRDVYPVQERLHLADHRERPL